MFDVSIVVAVINRRDIDFLLHEWLDIKALLKRPRFESHTPESIDAILTLAQDLAERELAPTLRSSDIDEPTIDEVGRVRVLPAVVDAVQLLAEACRYFTEAELPKIKLWMNLATSMTGVAAAMPVDQF